MIYRFVFFYEKMEPWIELQSKKPRGEIKLQEEQRFQQESSSKSSTEKAVNLNTHMQACTLKSE